MYFFGQILGKFSKQKKIHTTIFMQPEHEISMFVGNGKDLAKIRIHGFVYKVKRLNQMISAMLIRSSIIYLATQKITRS